MTKTFRSLTLATLAGTLISGYAFAQSASTSAMSSSDHMSGGAMSSMTHDAKAGAMTSKKHHAMSGKPMKSAAHMKSDHMKKMDKKGKKSGQMASGSMTSSR
jgi:hypothetical protein